MLIAKSRIHMTLAAMAGLALAFLATGEAKACPDCATSRSVWAEVAKDVGATLSVVSFAFAVVAGLIVVTARYMRRSRLLFGGCLLLGAGLGALLDGIVLHQVLQWHAMISSVVEPLDLVSSKLNMFWDGVFHLYAWITTVVAIAIIVRELPEARPQVRRSAVLGGALAGWGFFNLVEGLIDHHIWQLHHVHPGSNQNAWDAAFLALGVALVCTGLGIVGPVLRRREHRAAPVAPVRD